MTEVQSYSLGASRAEMARLDAQAASIAPATKLFLAGAGITAGMRVLDLGTGLGHVAFMLSEVVGPTGEVVGIDQSASLLEIAEQRRTAADIVNVHFIEADVQGFRDARAFDAVVGRLILFHLPDPVEALRHHVAVLANDGVMLMMDFDVGSVRSEPPVALFHAARDWVIQAFRQAGADPMVGTRLSLLLGEAGLTDVDDFGLQRYLPADDPVGPALLAGVVNTLAPVIIAAGLATEEQLALDSLQARLSDELQANHAVGLLPALAGGWGRKPPGTRRDSSRSHDETTNTRPSPPGWPTDPHPRTRPPRGGQR